MPRTPNTLRTPQEASDPTANEWGLWKKTAVAAAAGSLALTGCAVGADADPQDPPTSPSASADETPGATSSVEATSSATPTMDVSELPTETPDGIETTEPAPTEVETMREWSIDYGSFAEWGAKTPEQQRDAVNAFTETNGAGTIYIDDETDAATVIETMYRTNTLIEHAFWDKDNLDDPQIYNKVMSVVIGEPPANGVDYRTTKTQSLENLDDLVFGPGSVSCEGVQGAKDCASIKTGAEFHAIARALGVQDIEDSEDGSTRRGILATVIGDDPTGKTKDDGASLFKSDDLVANFTIVESPDATTWQIREFVKASKDYEISVGAGPDNRKDVSELELVKALRDKRVD